MAIDYAELEELSYSPDAPGESKKLTPEVLGRIVAYAWQVTGERMHGALHEGDMFDFLLTESPDAIPEGIRSILHVENRVDGRYLEERTRLMIGAQSADVVGRLNPSHISPVSKLDSIQANFLLRQNEIDFPQEVAWIRRAIARSAESSNLKAA
jgi:hypothetical protein